MCQASIARDLAIADHPELLLRDRSNNSAASWAAVTHQFFLPTLQQFQSKVWSPEICPSLAEGLDVLVSGQCCLSGGAQSLTSWCLSPPRAVGFLLEDSLGWAN